MQTIPTTDLASRLRLTLVRASRRLRQEAGTDLSPSQTAALSTIERHGPMTPSELAARERIQRPTATRVLTRLAERLERRDAEDRAALGRAADILERMLAE